MHEPKPVVAKDKMCSQHSIGQETRTAYYVGSVTMTTESCTDECAQPDTKFIPKPNPNPYLNPTSKQHTVMNIQLNIVVPEKFIRNIDCNCHNAYYNTAAKSTRSLCNNVTQRSRGRCWTAWLPTIEEDLQGPVNICLSFEEDLRID